MTVRSIIPGDIQKLQELYRQQGFPYELPDLNGPHIETVHVVADDNDEPLCAVIVERIVQVYFVCGDFGPPHAKSYALRMLHGSVSAELKTKGYSEATGFPSPPVAAKFSRWLEKRFGWTKNQQSWSVRF